MKKVASLCLLLPVLFLASCATRPKTYQPPDAARVNRATQDLNQKVVAARETAAKARAATLEAQQSAARLLQLATTLHDKLAKLKLLIPDTLRPAFQDVEMAADAQTVEINTLRQKLDDAVGWNDTLEKKQAEEERSRVELASAVDEYKGRAGGLANDATEERTKRIKAENSLSWYRWHFWGSWIALGLGVAACALFAFLKFTGRLALKIPTL